MAEETVDVRVTLLEGMRFEASGPSGHTVLLDAAPAFGGQGAGFKPMELLLVSYGGCTGMDVISILRKKRQEVTGLEIRLHGVRRAEHPKVYTEIELEYVVRGRGLSEEAVRRAIALSQEKYCSVGGMLKQAAAIRTRYRLVQEA